MPEKPLIMQVSNILTTMKTQGAIVRKTIGPESKNIIPMEYIIGFNQGINAVYYIMGLLEGANKEQTEILRAGMRHYLTGPRGNKPDQQLQTPTQKPLQIGSA